MSHELKLLPGHSKVCVQIKGQFYALDDLDDRYNELDDLTKRRMNIIHSSYLHSPNLLMIKDSYLMDAFKHSNIISYKNIVYNNKVCYNIYYELGKGVQINAHAKHEEFNEEGSDSTNISQSIYSGLSLY